MPRPMRSPVADLLAALGTGLESLGLRWYMFGAQAAIIHGAARLTADVDVTAALGDTPVRALVATLERHGFSVRVPDPDAFAARTRVVPLRHDPSGIPADVVLAGLGPEMVFLERATVHVVEGVPVPVASPEDIVSMKVLAGRPKDIEDAVAVLAARPSAIDLELVRNTLATLQGALDRSDLLPALDRAVERAQGRS